METQELLCTQKPTDIHESMGIQKSMGIPWAHRS